MGGESLDKAVIIFSSRYFVIPLFVISWAGAHGGTPLQHSPLIVRHPPLCALRLLYELCAFEAKRRKNIRHSPLSTQRSTLLSLQAQIINLAHRLFLHWRRENEVNAMFTAKVFYA